MADLRSIRRRISSIKSSKKISDAMRMVSNAKFTKFESKLSKKQEFIDSLHKIINKLAIVLKENTQLNPVRKIKIIIITSDRGLCGGLNHNIIKWAAKRIKKFESEKSIIIIGKQGVSLQKELQHPIEKSFINFLNGESTEQLDNLVAELEQGYNNDEFQEIYIIYNKFLTFLSQDPAIIKLLPIEPQEHEDSALMANLEFEPTPEEIAFHLYPFYIKSLLYAVALESQVSEHAARMNAMTNASKNATDLLEKLRLEYNKIRQEKITRELMEIISGTEAMK